MGFGFLVIQGEHKVLQTLITRKLRGIQTHFFFQNVTQMKKFFFLETNLSNGKKICLYSTQFSCNKCLCSGKNFMLTLYYSHQLLLVSQVFL